MDRPYTVKTNEKPTIWNIDALVGTFFMPIVGTLIGGYYGKARMEREAEFGKTVEPASFWNKGLMAGAVVGQLIGSAVGIAAFFTLAAMGMPEVGLILGHGSAVAGFFGGAVEGGLRRKGHLNEEYETAKAVHEAQQLSASRGHGRSQHQHMHISPEQSQALEARLSQGKGAEHAFTSKLEASQQQAPEPHRG